MATKRAKTTEECPERIGPYEVIEALGSGAMGIVYKARDLKGRIVAVKVLRSLGDDPNVDRRFLQEIRIYKNLIHHNIVIPLEVRRSPYPYIVMEYVAGKPLATAIRTGIRFDLDAIANIIEQIGNGLSYVHDLGIIHGDLNPQNIMLTKDHRKQLLVKILDFGISKTQATLIKFGSKRPREESEDIEPVEGAFGTPGYISPELFAGGHVDAKADIFSFGVIAHRLISGQTAYPGSTPWRTISKPKIARISPRFKAIFSKVLADAPDQRYASVKAFITDLEELFQSPKFRKLLINISATHAEDHPQRPDYTTQDILKWEEESNQWFQSL